MNALVGQYWARALKIARQYEAGDFAFADLTGLGEEFAASFTEQINELPEATRNAQAAAMEAKLQQGLAASGISENASQALNELLVSITRTPIY